ncbi:Uncharacterised protein [Vibrio cholerae]|nr:Uncharacterised protein [Vibrio cholerae]
MPDRLKIKWTKMPHDKPNAIITPVLRPCCVAFCTTKATSGPGLNKAIKCTPAKVAKMDISFMLSPHIIHPVCRAASARSL